jgi:hypothetical protein
MKGDPVSMCFILNLPAVYKDTLTELVDDGKTWLKLVEVVTGAYPTLVKEGDKDQVKITFHAVN